MPVIVILIGFVILLGFISYFIFKDGTTNYDSTFFATNAQAVSKIEKVGYGFPLHLKIPSINVDANVEYVGLTSDGAMDVPKGPEGVAWFDLGPHPGEKGTSVIDGHSGWKDGIPASFDKLAKVNKGDKIYVEDDNGATITFVVREFKTFDPKGDASSVFFDPNDGKSHLNLITCEGVWDEVTKSHSNRLVVFADKE